MSESAVRGKVWLITGTSSGLGRVLVEKAVARGDYVVATARQTSKIEDLAVQYPENVRVLQLDVTDSFEALCSKAKEAFSLWNQIDVVVNNAGFGCFGVIEEGGVEALLEIYKTNVFGVVNVTNAFLPYLRAKRDGTIIFIGSRSGWRTKFVGNGMSFIPFTPNVLEESIHQAFTAAPKQRYIVRDKFSCSAVSTLIPPIAIADALAEEVKPFGIRVYNLMPGGMRTQGINNIRWTRGESSLPDSSPKAIPDYNEMNKNISTYFHETNGNELGDARKVAKIMVDLVHCEGIAADKQPDVSLFLGSDAKRDVTDKCNWVLNALDAWSDVAISSDIRAE